MLAAVGATSYPDKAELSGALRTYDEGSVRRIMMRVKEIAGTASSKPRTESSSWDTVFRKAGHRLPSLPIPALPLKNDVERFAAGTGSLRSQTKVAMLDREPFAKRPSPAGWAEKEKGRARSPAKLEVRQTVKTFQRERLIRQRREEESGAACSQPLLISAASRLFATRRASCKGCAQSMAWRCVFDALFCHIAEQRFGLMDAA